MKEFDQIEKLVTEILETTVEARSDDYKLYVAVVKQLAPELAEKPFNDVLNNHYENGLPNWESVTRIRRKVQQQRPNLRDDRTVRNRTLRKRLFEEYARV